MVLIFVCLLCAQYYQAIGRFIGRALFEGILIDAHLALPVCKHILGIPITFSDLEFVDNDLYKNLKWLRENTGVESLALDFTYVLLRVMLCPIMFC